MMFSVDFPMFILDEKLILYTHMNVVFNKNNLKKNVLEEKDEEIAIQETYQSNFETASGEK